MSSLIRYLFKSVIVEDTDGNIYKGEVDMYCAAEDNDNDEESIGILTEPDKHNGIELYASEIKDIRLDNDKAPD